MDTHRKRRLLFRASRRGTKEMDILLGLFAQHTIETLEAEMLEQFATLLELPDALLYEWLTSTRESWPQEHMQILARITEFHKGRFL